MQTLSVIVHVYDATGEHLYVYQVDGRNIHAHGRFGGINDGLGLGRVHDGLLELLEQVVRELFTVFHDLNHFGVRVIVRHDFDQFWKVIAVPFSIKHAKYDKNVIFFFYFVFRIIEKGFKLHAGKKRQIRKMFSDYP